jgi:HlyD family secretion protein
MEMNTKVDELLEGASPRWWKRPALWIALLLLAAAAGGAWWWMGRQQTAAAPRFVTEEARLGDLTLTVTANGKLQATRTVNIGS